MFLPETVSADSLKSSLQLAADAHADATVAISLQNRWVAFRGKLAALADGQLYLRFPPPQPEGPKETLTGKTTQIIIKYRDYRFVGSVSLSASTAEGPLADCLCTALPREMKRFERRLHRRIEVPSNGQVRAEVRIGDDQSPAWAGRAVNLSVGGVQVRTSSSLLAFFEPGDVALVTVSFGVSGETFAAYAHFRGGARDGDMALAGFEFAETGTQQDYIKMLDTIGRHLDEMEKAGG